MNTLRLLLLAGGALSLPACSSLVGVRPHEQLIGAAPATAFDESYAQGKSHYLANRFGLAIACFEKALSIDPRSVAALNAIGAAYDDLHRYDIAMTYYDKAVAIEPMSADTYNNIGVSLMAAGKREDANAAFAKAATLDPQDHTIRMNVASAAGRRPTALQVVDDEDDPARPRIVRAGVGLFALYVPEDGVVDRAKRLAASGRRRGGFTFTLERAEPNIAVPREPVTAEPLLPPKG
jgi:tetratricopeptide (TPR) repeat protein